MLDNPAVMLQDFFAHESSAEAQREPEAMGMRTLDVKKALNVAPALSEENLPQLNEKDALLWVAYWRRIGFLTE